MRAEESSSARLAARRLSGILVQRLRFDLRPLEEARLPVFLGSTLRGGLAWGLRRVCCTSPGEECEGCLLRERCAYSYLIETPRPLAADRMRSQNKLPHPIVIVPPEKRKEPWTDRDGLEFDVLLLGSGTDHAPFVVAAVRRMASSGLGSRRRRFELSRAFAMNGDGENTELWSGGGSPVVAPRGTKLRDLVRRRRKSESVTLSFRTPVRIVHAGKAVEELSFGLFARALLSRLSNLAAFHCGVDLGLDFKGILSSAGEVETVRSDLEPTSLRRWSNRQQKSMDLHGARGEVTWRGPAVKELWPFIEAGELLHVGKGTVWGMGRYEIMGLANSFAGRDRARLII